MTEGPDRLASRVVAVAEAERIASQVAAATSGCPGVARLASGPVGTYLPGRVVTGVAVRDSSVRVAVVARYGPALREIAQQVRAAAAPLAPGRRVDVAFEDIEVPAVAGMEPGRRAAPAR